MTLTNVVTPTLSIPVFNGLAIYVPSYNLLTSNILKNYDKANIDLQIMVSTVPLSHHKWASLEAKNNLSTVFEHLFYELPCST